MYFGDKFEDKFGDKFGDNFKNIIMIIISIILGIIVGCIFFWKNNVTYHGPNSNIIKNEIIKDGNKCYTFEPAIFMCCV